MSTFECMTVTVKEVQTFDGWLKYVVGARNTLCLVRQKLKIGDSKFDCRIRKWFKY